MVAGVIRWAATEPRSAGIARKPSEPNPDASPKKRTRTMAAAGRAEVRALRAGLRRDTAEYLKRRSISALALSRYETAAAAYVSWARRSQRSTTFCARLDQDLAAYANHLFFLGRGIAEAWYAIWGLAWLHNFSVTRASFPQVAASLRAGLARP